MTPKSKKLIICDWNRTLFDPEAGTLYDDAYFFLHSLSMHTLVLVSALEASTKDDIMKQEVMSFFSEVYVGKEKNVDLFQQIQKQFPESEPWVIGDRIEGEILIGNLCNFNTIRILRGRFQHQIPSLKEQEPRYTVRSLRQALQILSS